jgi:hypothetical protein
MLFRIIPIRQEGRTRRHEREAEMRWTVAASVRRMMLRPDGEGVWSWHPWAGAKVAGDDPANDGDYEVTDTGESTKISVNTIVQGMPMFGLHL